QFGNLWFRRQCKIPLQSLYGHVVWSGTRRYRHFDNGIFSVGFIIGNQGAVPAVCNMKYFFRLIKNPDFHPFLFTNVHIGHKKTASFQKRLLSFAWKDYGLFFTSSAVFSALLANSEALFCTWEATSLALFFRSVPSFSRLSFAVLSLSLMACFSSGVDFL